MVYALQSKPTYTAKATLYPLTSQNESSLTSATLSGLLGLGDAPKSFSNEASINIVELALSRNVLEKVAASRLPNFENKTIGVLLIEEFNSNKIWFSKKKYENNDSLQNAVTGGQLLKKKIVARMNRNGLLELFYSGTNKNLISPIATVLIEKISTFYINLKTQKALADYKFAGSKVDSFEKVINSLDEGAVSFQKNILFTKPSQLEFSIPAQNKTFEKSRVLRQREISINNRDEAGYKLQKATPIISILDKPLPPFETSKNSPIAFFIIGFILGAIIVTLFLSTGMIYQVVKAEFHKKLMLDKK
jgi:hypothetical protein